MKEKKKKQKKMTTERPYLTPFIPYKNIYISETKEKVITNIRPIYFYYYYYYFSLRSKTQ